MLIGVGAVRFKASVVLLVMLGAAIPARADTITDQQNLVAASTLSSSSIHHGQILFGQSFTPTFSSIGFATFSFYTDIATAYEVELYSGAGFKGTLLATSNQATSPTSTAQSVEFDFATAVTLTPGTVYSLGVLEVSEVDNDLIAPISLVNSYAGGELYGTFGDTGYPTYDAVFGEGIIVASAAPEPSSLVLMGIGGAAGLGYVRRRRRCDVVA